MRWLARITFINKVQQFMKNNSLKINSNLYTQEENWKLIFEVKNKKGNI